jgi:hypothetical protein
MLDTPGRVTQHHADPLGFASEQPWPTRVVLDEGDRGVVRCPFTDRDLLEFFVADQV